MLQKFSRMNFYWKGSASFFGNKLEFRVAPVLIQEITLFETQNCLVSCLFFFTHGDLFNIQFDNSFSNIFLLIICLFSSVS